jgi:hypothetical protein
VVRSVSSSGDMLMADGRQILEDESLLNRKERRT